jgi:hypothetical protein
MCTGRRVLLKTLVRESGLFYQLLKQKCYGPSVEEREMAFYTEDPIHIYLFENYIWHDILVNRLMKEKRK